MLLLLKCVAIVYDSPHEKMATRNNDPINMYVKHSVLFTSDKSLFYHYLLDRFPLLFEKDWFS
jgi:hypothetical protein